MVFLFWSNTGPLPSQWLSVWSIPAREAHVIPRGMRAIVIPEQPAARRSAASRGLDRRRRVE
jgi:hypothetical protein